MSKGKFEPEKMVLLLGGPDASLDVAHYIGTIQKLECMLDASNVVTPRPRLGPWWGLAGIKSRTGRPVAWDQPNMILIEPDETPEQSAEAMRDLMQTKTKKEKEAT